MSGDGEWWAQADFFEARVGRGRWRRLQVDSPHGRRVDIYESPKGRNHYLYVDGVRYLPEEGK